MFTSFDCASDDFFSWVGSLSNIVRFDHAMFGQLDVPSPKVRNPDLRVLECLLDWLLTLTETCDGVVIGSFEDASGPGVPHHFQGTDSSADQQYSRSDVTLELQKPHCLQQRCIPKTSGVCLDKTLETQGREVSSLYTSKVEVSTSWVAPQVEALRRK